MDIGNASVESLHYHGNENTTWMLFRCRPTWPLKQTCFLCLMWPTPTLGESVTTTTSPSLLVVAARFVSQTQLVSSIAEEYAAQLSQRPPAGARLCLYHSRHVFNLIQAHSWQALYPPAPPMFCISTDAPIYGNSPAGKPPIIPPKWEEENNKNSWVKSLLTAFSTSEMTPASLQVSLPLTTPPDAGFIYATCGALFHINRRFNRSKTKVSSNNPEQSSKISRCTAF